MKENNLLASVALFSELYNNEKDIYDIIAEFLKEAIYLQNQWAFTPNEAASLLRTTFDFDIPDAVVNTVLRNRLQKQGLIKFENGTYSVIAERVKTNKSFEKELEETKSMHSDIFTSLKKYVEGVENSVLSNSESEILYSSFSSFLLDNNSDEKYFKLISSFIIENQDDTIFTKRLNVIKEGILLYTGIRYTADLNNLGSWTTDLTIFLDTEHLFNSTGLNGIVFKEIFDYFFELVYEINNSNKNKGGNKKIHLKYFEENKEEVDGFFYKAEQIILNKATLNPSKAAMISIVNGCKSPSDVIAKKTTFYADLYQKGITVESKVDYYKTQEHVVEGDQIFEEARKISRENGRDLDEDECRYYLKLFTKINYLRKGNNKAGMENIGYLFLTAKSMALFLAHNIAVKFNGKDIPFAMDLDFVTNKFWFKLKKGLNKKNGFPKSFDIVTKAQVVLSAQINNFISSEYDKLSSKYRKGEITKEDAIELNYSLRERPSKPEDMTVQTIEESLSFLNSDNIEKHLREKSLLYKKVEEGELAKAELRKIGIEKWLIKKKPAKRWGKFLYLTGIVFYCSLILALLSITIYYFIKLCQNVSNLSDSLPDLIGLVALLVFEILPIIKLKKYHRWLIKKVKHNYKMKLTNLSNKIS
jgi:hypothetical protein